MTDSECMAKAWARVHFPLSALAEQSGVFIGFHQAAPFVVKGSAHSDLIAAWHRETGAVFFASEIPSFLATGVFDQVVEINCIEWFGRELDASTLDAQPYNPHQEYSRQAYANAWNAYPWYPERAAEKSEEDFLANEAAIREMDEYSDLEDLDDEDLARWSAVRGDWRQGKQVDETSRFS